MAHDKEHPIAGIAFLILAAGLVVFAGKAGLDASRKSQLKEEVVEAAKQGDSGDLPGAQKVLQEIVADHPEHVEALFLLAGVEARLQHLDEADKLYARVLALDPDDWESVAERASIAKKKGDVEAGIAMLEQIPKGKGHIEERLTDEVWYELHGDPRLEPILEKQNIGRENGVRPSRTATSAVVH